MLNTTDIGPHDRHPRQSSHPLSPERFLQLHTQTFAHLHADVDATHLELEKAVLEEERLAGRVKRASLQALADDIHGLDRRSIYDHIQSSGGGSGRRPLSLVAKLQNHSHNQSQSQHRQHQNVRSGSPRNSSEYTTPTFGLYTPPATGAGGGSYRNSRRISSDSFSTASPLPTTPYFDYPTMLEPVLEPAPRSTMQITTPCSSALYDPPSCVGTGSESFRDSVAQSDLTWDEDFSGDGDDLGLAARYVIPSEEGVVEDKGQEPLPRSASLDSTEEEKLELKLLEERRRRILAIAQSTRLLEGKATRIPDDPNTWGTTDPAKVYLNTLRLPTISTCSNRFSSDPHSKRDGHLVVSVDDRGSGSSTTSSTWGIGLMQKWWTSEQPSAPSQSQIHSRIQNSDSSGQDFREGETGSTRMVVDREDGDLQESKLQKSLIDLERIDSKGTQSPLGKSDTITTTTAKAGWKSRRLTGFLSPFQLATSPDIPSPNSTHTTTKTTTTTSTPTIKKTASPSSSPISEPTMTTMIQTREPILTPITSTSRQRDKAQIFLHRSSHSSEISSSPSSTRVSTCHQDERKLPKSIDVMLSDPSLVSGPVLMPVRTSLVQVSLVQSQVQVQIPVPVLPDNLSKPLATTPCPIHEDQLMSNIPRFLPLHSHNRHPLQPPISDHYSYRSSFPQGTILACDGDDDDTSRRRRSDPSYLRHKVTVITPRHQPHLQPRAHRLLPPLEIKSNIRTLKQDGPDPSSLNYDTIPPFFPGSPSSLHRTISRYHHHHIVTSDIYVPHSPKAKVFGAKIKDASHSDARIKVPPTSPSKWLFILGFVFPLLWFFGACFLSSSPSASSSNSGPAMSAAAQGISNPRVNAKGQSNSVPLGSLEAANTVDLELGVMSIDSNDARWMRWFRHQDPWIERCRVAAVVSGGTFTIAALVLVIVLPTVFLT